MSIEYYNKNAKQYIDNTFKIEMKELYFPFERYLNPQAKVLDLGSGTGRDSIYFQNQGYDVYAVDASIELVNFAKQYLGNRAINATFQGFVPKDNFDGIWACASLLHLEDDELIKIIKKYIDYLNKDGIFYISFKKRNKSYTKDGRYFNCFSKSRFQKFIKEISNLKNIEMFYSNDQRKERNQEVWLNVILKKI